MSKAHKQYTEPEPLVHYQNDECLMINVGIIAICHRDFTTAAILTILITRIEEVRLDWYREQVRDGEVEPEFWITLSYKEVMEALYGYVKDKKTILTRLAWLVDQRFVRRRANP